MLDNPHAHAYVRVHMPPHKTLKVLGRSLGRPLRHGRGRKTAVEEDESMGTELRVQYAEDDTEEQTTPFYRQRVLLYVVDTHTHSIRVCTRTSGWALAMIPACMYLQMFMRMSI